MNEFDNFKKYLPEYLSSASEKLLYDELANYPNNMGSNFYVQHDHLLEALLQGDGVRSLLVVNTEDMSTKDVPCMIISNSCDIDETNKRPFRSNVVYAPIFNLGKFSNGLLRDGIKTKSSLPDYIELIKKQRITQILYLPSYGSIIEDSIVFLDRVFNLPLDRVKLSVGGKKAKLFTLGDYGFYVFLFKLSLHFTRIRERVDRNIGEFCR